MRPAIVRILTCTSVAAAVLLSACSGDKPAGGEKLKELTAGVSRDSLFALMGDGPMVASGSDSVRLTHGYRRSNYFLNGQNFEVIYARDLAGNVSEPVLQAVETPVVLDGAGKVLGWGWRYYVDDAMGKLGLPTPLFARDTMTASPKPDSVAKPTPSAAAALDSAIKK